MTALKTIRTEKKLTQQEAAKALGVSLRTYVEYENNDKKTETLKYRYLLDGLNKINYIDETNGIILLDDLCQKVKIVLADYDVKFCYLFGSYAKGIPTEESDVDLLISTTTTGLKYYEMVERLRQELHKKIDLLDMKQLVSNEQLIEEVLKDGIKIYG
ncbi:MAG: helix-turn-helix domain-containing protein [Lachnospiraceae bacterium]|nr:helix-turn-helix domain-containing protein [Lachnospiraceae bacterium]MBQ2467353.1 helix-turn-helix domain-containing protein [Lachnospiraceae bacterium]MBQ2503452.1 helix-turn-helix domain-containing protein [Lachnospiraceae bacterium]MBQ2577938.1 helix-turn-helix domain-containing protein [Lachnospiraceae bacterium]